MRTFIKIIVAIIAAVLLFKIIKGVLGLLLAVAAAAVLYFGATKLLEKK